MAAKSQTKSVGFRIKKCRETLGLSQENLAADIGVSVQTISCAERGKRSLGMKNLSAAAERLNVTVDYIINGNKIAKDYTLLASRIQNLNEDHQNIIAAVVAAMEAEEAKS